MAATLGPLLRAAAFLGAGLAAGAAPLGGSAAPVHAAPVPPAPAGAPDTLDLSSLIGEALAAHPRVVESRARESAARERVAFEGAWENPVLELALDELSVEGGGPGEKQIGLLQRIPFPGRSGVRTDAARRRSEAAAETRLAAERAVIADVKEAYWELFALERRVEILRESRRALGDVIEAASTRYETGLGGVQEVLLARVEDGTLKGDIRHAESLAAAARSRLNRLAGRQANAPLGAAAAESLTPFDSTLDELLAAMREARPAIRAAERGVAAQEAESRLVRGAWRPDLEVGAMYMRRPDETDEWRASLAFALPVWKARREDAAAREGERRVEAARAELDGERLRAAVAVEEQFAHVESEREIVDLYRRDILPQAELAFQSARAGYLAGREGFLTLLETLRNQLELRGAYYEFFADSEMHLARLEEAVGRDLDATGARP